MSTPVTPSEYDAWMRAHEAALDAGEPGAAAAIRAAREVPATRLAAHNLIERRGLDGAFAQMFGLNCRIAPRDDIFHFFAGHPTSTNPLRDYLADGWRTLAELMQLLEAVDRPLLKLASVLEFASGHGRFTRHLVKAIGPQRVTVSDVVADAVGFARDTFGVQGFVSDPQPEAVAAPLRAGVRAVAVQPPAAPQLGALAGQHLAGGGAGRAAGAVDPRRGGRAPRRRGAG